MVVGPGDTFRPNTPVGEISHLYIVITEDNGDGEVACLNFTTWEQGEVDEACLLEPGDHPFIRHKTVVKYGLAKWWPKDRIEKGIASKQLLPDEPLSPKLLERVIAGVLASKFLKLSIKMALEDD